MVAVFGVATSERRSCDEGQHAKHKRLRLIVAPCDFCGLRQGLAHHLHCVCTPSSQRRKFLFVFLCTRSSPRRKFLFVFLKFVFFLDWAGQRQPRIVFTRRQLSGDATLPLRCHYSMQGVRSSFSPFSQRGDSHIETHRSRAFPSAGLHQSDLQHHRSAS